MLISVFVAVASTAEWRDEFMREPLDMTTCCSHTKRHTVVTETNGNLRESGTEQRRMRKDPQTLADLSPAQRQLMEIIWDRGEASASEVRKLFSQERALARNTVRTMLLRMEEKGWLTHRVEGRTHFYRAAVAKDATVGQKVQEIIDTLCGGSPETLVTALLDHRGLTDGELNRIRAMLDTARRNKGKARKRRN